MQLHADITVLPVVGASEAPLLVQHWIVGLAIVGPLHRPAASLMQAPGVKRVSGLLAPIMLTIGHSRELFTANFTKTKQPNAHIAQRFSLAIKLPGPNLLRVRRLRA